MFDHHSRRDRHFCGHHAGMMRGFIQPWLLMLLRNGPSHGYQLLEGLKQNEGTRDTDPGHLYRTLRHFEEEGLVRSCWDMDAPGPARRVYEITADGLEYLKAWAEHIRSTRKRLDQLLDIYDSNSDK